MATSDDDLIGRVRNTLLGSAPPGQLHLRRLAFEPDGVLVIEGETESLAAKKRTLRLAAAASRAPGVVDRLHVRPALPAHDGEMRAHLAELFALDDRFRDIALYEDLSPSPLVDDEIPVAGPAPGATGRLSVAVRDGIITLDGALPSLTRMRLAGALAWRVPGARDVVNGVAVEPPEEDGPDQLEEAVRETLDGNPLFDDAQIKVGVRGDSVRLTGLVHSPEAHDEAEECAWRVLGVDEVINALEIGPPAQRSSG